MIYGDTLDSMTGAVRNVKSNADPAQVEQFLNFRQRQIYNIRPIWAGGIGRGVLAVPQSYNTGTVTTALGSNIVTGSGTAWPVNDLVNTTIVTLIRQPGRVAVTPASMTNITPDTWLYVDGGGANPEVVYVLQTNTTSFTAVFRYSHAANVTATTSSLAYRTLRTGYQQPNFLITAVTSATSLLIDIPWGGDALTAIGYTILKNLYNFAPDLKMLLSAVDPRQGIEMLINYPLGKLNQEDPQRAAIDFPRLVATHSMSPAGTAMFEIWPSPTTNRQIYFEYYKQPYDMKAPGDTPPPYIDGGVLVAGAIADALRTKVTEDDPYYDPNTAEVWEQRFLSGVDRLAYADDNLFNQSYTWRSGSWSYPSGANFDQSHDAGIWTGNY